MQLLEGPSQYLRDNRKALLAELSRTDLTPQIHYHLSESMEELDDASVQLVVTSPPYPMIEMWDGLFEKLLHLERGSLVSLPNSFDLCHKVLEKTWSECNRALEEGGLLCINIGDATRSVDGNFRCYMNHTRITEVCERVGFQSLVPLLWQKPTNKPNAFLGSGFYPPNAYVTLDCEYILLLRKGSKRKVTPHDPLRYASQYSKGERDVWFSQIWDFRGAAQNQAETAPFPDELPYRLIRMFSSIGDTILDPFLGTGTTLKVAWALGRKGIGYEVNHSLKTIIDRNVPSSPPAPEDVLDRLISLYETKNHDTQFSKTTGSDLRDKILTAFR